MAGREIEEIQFVDLDTDAPIATVTGDLAQILLHQSQLIQNMLEMTNQKNPRVLVVPIGDFPTDRRVLFAKVLKGFPVGKFKNWRYEYYPLGSEEEKDIQKAVNAKIAAGNRTNRNEIVNQERYAVIHETLRYLLIPDTLIDQMLEYDDQHMPERGDLEDEIEGRVADHAVYLYLTGQEDKLTEKERGELKTHFDKVKNKYNTNMRKLQEEERRVRRPSRRRYLYSEYNNNNNNNYNYFDETAREIQNTYDFETDQVRYIPEAAEVTKGMTTKEYEKFLRTQYYKPKKPLGIQTNVGMNLLFNRNSRANRTRANERNNSAVFFYNPNKPYNKTRKNNKKKPNKNNKKPAKNAWTNV